MLLRQGTHRPSHGRWCLPGRARPTILTSCSCRPVSHAIPHSCRLSRSLLLCLCHARLLQRLLPCGCMLLRLLLGLVGRRPHVRSHSRILLLLLLHGWRGACLGSTKHAHVAQLLLPHTARLLLLLLTKTSHWRHCKRLASKATSLLPKPWQRSKPWWGCDPWPCTAGRRQRL